MEGSQRGPAGSRAVNLNLLICHFKCPLVRPSHQLHCLPSFGTNVPRPLPAPALPFSVSCCFILSLTEKNKFTPFSHPTWCSRLFICPPSCRAPVQLSPGRCSGARVSNGRLYFLHRRSDCLRYLLLLPHWNVRSIKLAGFVSLLHCPAPQDSSTASDPR